MKKMKHGISGYLANLRSTATDGRPYVLHKEGHWQIVKSVWKEQILGLPDRCFDDSLTISVNIITNVCGTDQWPHLRMSENLPNFT